MYLIDTSVWIDFLRGRSTQSVRNFNEILEENLAYGITGVIYQEILQGASSAEDFKQLANYLSTQRFFHFKDQVKSYENAAKIYYQCRQEGITIRSSIDCLIAQIAIEHKLTLVHSDKDFERISRVTSLKLL